MAYGFGYLSTNFSQNSKLISQGVLVLFCKFLMLSIEMNTNGAKFILEKIFIFLTKNLFGANTLSMPQQYAIIFIRD